MNDTLSTVLAYHEATKHHTHGYAPSPGFLDWDSQPNPFRRYAGTATVPLPLVSGRGRCHYDALYDTAAQTATPLSAEALGLWLELALGLSAWKVAGADRWALRNNPSSGNLHPTEGYLLLWQEASADLIPGLYHYASDQHLLECRAILPRPIAAAVAQRNPGSFGALGLTSIHWREAWKYGARAYRYCQHDVGHALASARFGAAVLGWKLTLDTGVADDDVAACLGLDTTDENRQAEPEHPDLLAIVGKSVTTPAPSTWSDIAQALSDWSGRPNRLSRERVHWPQITQVLPAVHKGGQTAPASMPAAQTHAVSGLAVAEADAVDLIRQRRSAQRMDGVTGMARAAFERTLERTLPTADRAPFDAFGYPAAINLLLYVHAVEGIQAGLYALIRTPERGDAFRNACAAQRFDWTPLADTALPLLRLRAPLDVRKTASQQCCYQGIAGRGAFSVGMIADLGHCLTQEGAWAYRRLYWEAGLIGQVLYLEAEAAGLRGTGIGCYFDDEVHRLLGLDSEATAGTAWQSLYHFTIGGPIEDRRLSTEPPYAHLADRAQR
jgi:SagB-type dehydrogenase family enzyme